MDSDPFKIIPVGPIRFEHPLRRFARGVTKGKPRIVAIGSSTTAGEGSIRPYPDRLLSMLQSQIPNAKFTMINQGIGGQEAPIELERFDADVIAEKPDLVIWQVGTNAVWQSADSKPPPPTFDETIRAIQDGLIKLHNETSADVILMDLQYLPAVLTPANEEKASAMVEAIGREAKAADGVNLFPRFEFMRALHKVEKVSFDRMVDPGDPTRLHQSDWVTDRVTMALKDAIADGVSRAWSAEAARTG